MGERLKAHIKSILAFMTIWMIGCALADHVFHLGANSWRMFWGAVVVMIMQGIDELTGWSRAREPHQGRGGGE